MSVTTQLFDLTGQVALITGASKGMGKAMAMALAEHGSKVVISSRKLDQCEETAAEINAACGGNVPSPLPVTSATKSSYRLWSTKPESAWVQSTH